MRNYIIPDQLDWDKNIRWSLFVYNTVRNESTKLSPYNVLYGCEARTPLTANNSEIDKEDSTATHCDIWLQALKNMIKAQETQKRYYDQSRRAQDFQMLDSVMVKSHAPAREDTRKFSPSWKGPFVILKLLTHDNERRAVEVLDTDKCKAKRVAFQDLKHYVIRTVEESSENIPGVAIQHAIQNSVQGNQHGPEAPVSLIANYDSNTYNDNNFSSLQETRVLLDT